MAPTVPAQVSPTASPRARSGRYIHLQRGQGLRGAVPVGSSPGSPSGSESAARIPSTAAITTEYKRRSKNPSLKRPVSPGAMAESW